jgi:hypothetical protein
MNQKKTFTFFVACLFTAFAFGQTAPNVPGLAKTDLTKRFPNAATAKWVQEGKEFEAEWVENGHEVSVAYDVQGKWLATERELDKTALPSEVSLGLQKVMAGAEVVEAESVEKPGKAMAYEVKVKYAGKVKEVLLDAQGKVLKQGEGSGSGSSEKEGSGSGSDEGSGSGSKSKSKSTTKPKGSGSAAKTKPHGGE